MSKDTVEDFIRRGGQVVMVPYKEPKIKDHIIKQNTSGPANILTLYEGSLLYGESSKRKDLTKKPKKIKISAKELSEAKEGVNKAMETLAKHGIKIDF